MEVRDKLIGLFILVVIAVLAGVWLMPTGLKQAPEVTLKTLEGRRLQLSELRGKPLLVTFWAATCPGCMKEMPYLAELYRELHPRGLEIIGIAMDYDSIEDIKALIAHRQIPYLITHNDDARVARAFGDVQLTPTSFLIAPDARIVQQKIGEMDRVSLRDTIVRLLDGQKVVI